MPRSSRKYTNKKRSYVKTREKVRCTCMLHCGGNKLVDPRAKRNHQEEEKRLQTRTSKSRESKLTSQSTDYINKQESSKSDKKYRKDVRKNLYSTSDSSDDSSGNKQIHSDSE